MRVLMVGGTFDDNGGRSSGYFAKLAEEVNKCSPGGRITLINGGYFNHLQDISNRDYLQMMDVIIWMVNVPNDKEKLVRDVKSLAPRCMLITSKANYDGRYGFQDLISRALQNKSNLLVEFTKDGSEIMGSIIDPIGNSWCRPTANIYILVKSLMDRTRDLMSYTRMGSKSLGGEPVEVPDNQPFFDVINNCAERFHTLIHGVDTPRFLGNASFRCTKGFPSMRGVNGIFVSKRNIDKRDLGKNGFVACRELTHYPAIEFYGDHKPSVDTPCQLMLYNFYGNINYMMHSHVYVAGAPMTSHAIPCGAIEEVDEVISVIPWHDVNHFAINLKGHGSLILCNNVDEFSLYTDKFIARPAPERM